MCGALQSLLLLLCTRRTCWTSLRYSSSVACRWKPLALASSGGKPSSCARKCCPVVYLQHTQKEQGWGEICQHNSSLLCTTYRATPFSIPCKCAVPHFEISCTVHRLGGCWACKGVIKCPLHWTPQMPQKHHTGYARQHSSEQHTHCPRCAFLTWPPVGSQSSTAPQQASCQVPPSCGPHPGVPAA